MATLAEVEVRRRRRMLIIYLTIPFSLVVLGLAVFFITFKDMLMEILEEGSE